MVAGPVHPSELLSSRRSVAYKGTADIGSARDRQKRSRVLPARSPCADTGHPRAARRGRLVVEGLRTGTPDAESPAYTTPLQLGNPGCPCGRAALTGLRAVGAAACVRPLSPVCRVDPAHSR